MVAQTSTPSTACIWGASASKNSMSRICTALHGGWDQRIRCDDTISFKKCETICRSRQTSFSLCVVGGKFVTDGSSNCCAVYGTQCTSYLASLLLSMSAFARPFVTTLQQELLDRLNNKSKTPSTESDSEVSTSSISRTVASKQQRILGTLQQERLDRLGILERKTGAVSAQSAVAAEPATQASSSPRVQSISGSHQSYPTSQHPASSRALTLPTMRDFAI